MPDLQREPRSGLAYLETVTTLLQRVRASHPTAGLYEAADFNWWWRDPRPTDELGQLFWFDADGRPEAAVIVTDWGDRVALDPILLPGAAPALVTEVVERGLANAAAAGYEQVALEADPEDSVLVDLLVGRGFDADADGVVEAWLDGGARPAVSQPADGYLLRPRSETMDRQHPMTNERRNHRDTEPRLRQTSLYRPDLDLAVFDEAGEVAAYGLFWFDPSTATGLVEPMRTEDDHQGRGLARHVLTTGVDLLATAGAKRIKICYELDNPPASHLYLDVGFEPHRQTVMLSGSTA